MKMESIKIQACITNTIFNSVWEENFDITGISSGIKSRLQIYTELMVMYRTC